MKGLTHLLKYTIQLAIMFVYAGLIATVQSYGYKQLTANLSWIANLSHHTLSRDTTLIPSDIELVVVNKSIIL